MRFPSREEVRRIRKKYPKGTTVRLISMQDPQAPPVGTLGEVTWTDDAGTVHVSWSNGSTLGFIEGVDRVQKVERISEKILKAL
ncbi:MAG: DUF4314 domain-containing protein [Firmicutes bacterium]|nr:DUF4314 domain-containing protein [Bacillota bacterium]